MAWMKPEEFCEVVRLTPLVSIDLILRDPDGRALVGHRTNEPAKGWWFVPGGRIEKDEKLVDAFARILKVETGLAHPLSASRLLGVYEHFYPTNRYQQAGYGTHYVVIGRELQLDRRPDIAVDDQHSAIAWLTPEEILSRDDVHENTKAYFR
jgi:colanic acid biosynthesis protein WcaH